MPSKSHKNNCHRCGMKGHWSRIYRTSKNFADLYQASIKEKGTYIEINFTDINELDLAYYDTNFFGGLSAENTTTRLSITTNFIAYYDTRLSILQNSALHSRKSIRNLLSFKDTRINGYHIETMNESNTECLYITSIVYGKKLVMEKLSSFSCRLYHTIIKSIESYVVMNHKFNNPKTFILWHDRLGHPKSSMMRRIIEHSHRHPLKDQKVLLPNEYPCAACSQGKLIVKTSFNKVTSESPVFLERIHWDICGPIHPPCGPFRYFMVLIYAFTRWSHMCLILTRNVVFTILLAQMIK